MENSKLVTLSIMNLKPGSKVVIVSNEEIITEGKEKDGVFKYTYFKNIFDTNYININVLPANI